MDNTIVNLSTYNLSKNEISLLQRGLNFCPTPGQPDPGLQKTDLDNFHRKIRLHNHFFGEDFDDDILSSTPADNLYSKVPFEHQKFRPKSTFNPTGPHTIEAFITANEINFNQRPNFKPGSNNLTHGEREALNSLKKNKEIIIKPADKGGALVIQNTLDYILEGEKHLSNTNFYQPLDSDPTPEYTEEINQFLHNMFLRGEIDATVYQYIVGIETRTPNIYFLPKIHKQTRPPPGRPVVSGNGSPTERISEFIDHFINPPSTCIKSFVKDTTHMIQILSAVKDLPVDPILVTCDVSSLYTSIPTKQGIDVIKSTLADFRPTPEIYPTNESLIKLLEFVLNKNNFKFDGKNYLQINGCAMGSKCSPSFAILFMDYFEQQFLETYHLQPLMYKRYIDDIFMIWTHGQDELNKFLEHINSCSEHIKFTWETSKTSVNFLDLTIKISNNHIVTDLYTKPTDSHNYLLYSSAHPNTCKKSIPYSQFLRIRRICSNIEDFDKHVLEFSQHFIRREYPVELIQQAALKARRLDRASLLLPKPTNKNKEDKHILICTFNPTQNTLPPIIRNNWSFLGKSSNTLSTFNTPMITAYRRPQNLRDVLVRAAVPRRSTQPMQNKATTLEFPTTISSLKKQSKIQDFFNKDLPNTTSQSSTSLYTQNPNTTIHSSKSCSNIKTKLSKNTCSNFRCKYCQPLDKSGTIRCHVTGKQFPSKYNVSCKSSNLIYCLSCKTCGQQYVGQTKRRLHQRLLEHFYNINKTKQNQLKTPHPVATHFALANHKGTQDITVHILDFISYPPQSTKSLNQRLKYEKKWIHLLRCPAPTGLNMMD